ncbi:unnamed protein product [Prunus armeniaca]
MRVDQLAQRMDDQNALMRQLLNQISVAQNLGLGQPGEERRIDERTGGQLNRHQVGQAGVRRQRDAQPRDQLTDMSQAYASHTQSNVRERLGPRLDVRARLGPQGNVLQRLGSQGGQIGNRRNEDREERRSAAHSHRNIQERLGP